MSEIKDQEALYEMAQVIAKSESRGFGYREDVVADAYLAVAEGAGSRGDIQNAVRQSLRGEWGWRNRRVSVELADALMRDGAPERARLDIHGAMAALTPKQRDVVAMKFWEGLTEEEIAAELKITHQAANQLLARALFAMRIFFDEGCKTAGPNALVIQEESALKQGNANCGSEGTNPAR